MPAWYRRSTYWSQLNDTSTMAIPAYQVESSHAFQPRCLKTGWSSQFFINWGAQNWEGVGADQYPAIQRWQDVTVPVHHYLSH